MANLGGTRIRRRLIAYSVWLALSVALAGCRPDSDGAGGQWYHAVLANEQDDEIPFFLRVPDACEDAPAIILNGEERLEAPCRLSPVGFVVDFPVYGTKLEAWFKPDATVTGHWCREAPSGREPVLALTAEPIAEPDRSRRFRFPEPPKNPETEPGLDVAGDWRIEFDGRGIGKGVFEQHPSGVVTGSIEVASEYGDMRFLAGNAWGKEVRLSTFDGQHAYLIQGEAGPDGGLEGAWTTGHSRHRFVAERSEGFELPHPLSRISFARGQSLELETLLDPRFVDKPVVVDIFGTWCPNCNDHAPVLVELYRKYEPQGLQMLGLAFELNPDAEYNARRIEAFKQKHGVLFEIVLADEPIETLVTEGVAGLGPIEGVPVTIFLNRAHEVHAIYSGFSGPATGEAHLEAKAELERLTLEILDGL